MPWKSPPSSELLLAPNQVHLWRATGLPPDPWKALPELEQNLIQSVMDETIRMQKLAARSTLRILLAKYLNLLPHEISLLRTSAGKPYLIQKQNPLNIEFNLSHTSIGRGQFQTGETVFGFTLGQKIGVDLEFNQRRQIDLKVARRFFSPNEINLITQSNLSCEVQKNHLLRLWVCKESLAKALGLSILPILGSTDFTKIKPFKWFTPSSHSDYGVFYMNQKDGSHCAISKTGLQALSNQIKHFKLEQ